MNSQIQAMAGGALALLLASSSAFAQQPAAPARPAAAPAAAAITGPAIPGLCVFSVEGAVGSSKVGAHVNTRLQQLLAQVQAELTGLRTAIENEDKTLAAQRATLDATTLEQRAAALQVRVNDMQRRGQLRERELGATEQKALARVGQELSPLVQQVANQRQCSVVLNRQAVVLGGGGAMDITPAIVTALDAKISQFAFERERLDQQAAAPAGATAR